MDTLRAAAWGRCRTSYRRRPTTRDEVCSRATRSPVREKRVDCSARGRETTLAHAALRDNPECAQEEYDRILDAGDPGLHVALTFDPKEDIARPIVTGAAPRVAILREQGVNGQIEMAAAFDRAGLRGGGRAHERHRGRESKLDSFKGFAACGGFSYGDVLGAGEGWAKSILFNRRARDEFEAFFARGTPSRWACATAAR
jgi:phosphoribosylformylglycinamidine synthase